MRLIYLRPSECMRLTAQCLVAPVKGLSTSWGLTVNDCHQGVAGKTGILDESVLVQAPILDQCLEVLKATLAPAATLWNFSMATLRLEFQSSCQSLGFGAMAQHLYALRHGGVSHDLLTKALTVVEAQRKGRWMSPKSLRRYAKETRLLAEVEKLNPELINLSQQIDSQWNDVLCGGNLGNWSPVPVALRFWPLVQNPKEFQDFRGTPLRDQQLLGVVPNPSGKHTHRPQTKTKNIAVPPKF